MSACIKVSKVIEALYTQFAFWRNTVMEGESIKADTRLSGMNPVTGGLHFCVQIRVEDSGFEADSHTFHAEWANTSFKYLHIIITRWHNLHTAVGDSPDIRKIKLSDWTNLSNHESCWNSAMDSFISENWFNAIEEAQAGRPEELRKPPYYYSECADISLSHFWGNVFQYVEIEKGPMTDSYHYSLKAILLFKIKSIELESVPDGLLL